MLKKIANKIIKNHEASTVIKNFIFLSLIKVAGMVFPLIVLPYLTGVIGAAYFGAISYAAAIIIFFETFTDWGFNYTATRDVAQNRDDSEKVNEIYSEVFYGRIFLMVVSLIILLILIYAIPQLYDFRLLLLLTFLYIPGNILFSEWIFQSFERMKYITYLNLLSKLIFTLLIFVVIRDKEDYFYQPLLYAAGFISSGIIAQYIIRRYIGIRLYFPSVGKIISRIKSSSNMFISLFLPNLYTNFTTIILKSFGGETATGIYSGGQRLQLIIDSVTQTLSRAFFPYLARHKEKHYIYVLVSGGFSLLASAAMFFGADWFVSVFLADGFEESATVMKIFSITPFFLFLINSYGTNYLVIVGKENIMRNIIVFCSIFGFILTWYLTAKYSYIGAAATITIVWGVRGVLTYLFAKREKKRISCQKY